MNELVVDDLMKESILVPGLPEQERIGALFSYLDNLITLHQRKPVPQPEEGDRDAGTSMQRRFLLRVLQAMDYDVQGRCHQESYHDSKGTGRRVPSPMRGSTRKRR